MDSDSDIKDYKVLAATFDPTQMTNFVNALRSASDEESENSNPVPRAPRRFLRRNREAAANRLFEDYFADKPTFPADFFRRRYRMRKEFFLHICQSLTSYVQESIPDYYKYFHQRLDATGKLGFDVFRYCTSAIRQLAYGCAPNAFDEYLHMGQQTSYDCLDNFTKCVFHLFSPEFLRKPTQEDVQRLVQRHGEIHGFPGMLRSIHCMHWGWKNCPTAWQGQYTRADHEKPTIMLEAVASYDMCIWHAYFGSAGSSNDINVLNNLDLFNDLLQDRALSVNFNIVGRNFTKGYYLADGIYPEWSTLVKSYRYPMTDEEIRYSKFQKATRKDVERAFGVLQGRWGIIKSPARAYSTQKIKRIMYCCVILHNMITQDNGRNMCRLGEDYLANEENIPTRTWEDRLATYRRMDKELRDRQEHHVLRGALIQHIAALPPYFRAR